MPRAAAVLMILLGALPAAGLEPLLTFHESVSLALRQSPYLSVSEMEVEIQRLGEADSRADYIPQFSLRTRYYLDQPEDSGRRFYLEFSVDPYNPVEAHVSLKARRLLTQLATREHLQSVADMLRALGEVFLELDAVDRVAVVDEELVEAAEARAARIAARSKLGSAGELERDVAGQEEEMARLQRQQGQAWRQALLERAAALMGWSGAALPEPEVRQAAGQIFGDDAADPAPWDFVRTNALEAAIWPLQRQLQELNITAARAAYIPDLLIGVRTPDPLSGLQDEDLYFSVGVDIPIWDGWKRARQVNRQRQALAQQSERGVVGEADLKMRWRAAENAWRLADLDARAARLREALADIRYRQAVAAGAEEELELARRTLLEARRQSVFRELARDKALLSVDFISGRLLNRFCRTEMDAP